MDRFAISLPTLALATLVGCGSQSESPVADHDSSTPTPTVTRAATSGPSPTDVVSQFLDEVRRGGQHSPANDLLTTKARSELRRIGQSIQPIGSPDARFEVTRAESVPGESDSALVHSIWSEPAPDGSKTDFQVVWAVQHEAAGWRISGLAMELEPGQDPIVMDFENAEMMSALLSAPAEEPASSDKPANSRAAAPSTTLPR
jgi:hypothetical protein